MEAFCTLSCRLLLVYPPFVGVRTRLGSHQARGREAVESREMDRVRRAHARRRARGGLQKAFGKLSGLKIASTSADELLPSHSPSDATSGRARCKGRQPCNGTLIEQGKHKHFLPLSHASASPARRCTLNRIAPSQLTTPRSSTGVLRLGTLVNFGDYGPGMQWRHAGCITAKQFQNLHDTYSSVDCIPGFEDLDKEDKYMLQRAWDRGDRECCFGD